MGKLKTGGRCPKCGGNLYLEKDYHGWYEECLQCAHMKDLVVVYQSKKRTEKEARELAHIKRVQGINKDVASE